MLGPGKLSWKVTTSSYPAEKTEKLRGSWILSSPPHSDGTPCGKGKKKWAARDDGRNGPPETTTSNDDLEPRTVFGR